MTNIDNPNNNEPLIPAEALINTIEAFGISYNEISQIIGQREEQILASGIEPESETGKSAIKLIN